MSAILSGNAERTRTICIDGPNGVGKTAVARGLARRLGWRWLSVGAVYRAIASSRARTDTTLRLLACPAEDGVLDPVIEVGGIAYTERQLLGSDLGRLAENFAGQPVWQHKVNTELRRYGQAGLVAEGRATREIFPSAALDVYLWADPLERRMRTAAVTGGQPDLDRDRRDSQRSTETLRVRPGGVVWNSTRYSLDDTVAGLFRRMRLVTAMECVVLGMAAGPPTAAAEERTTPSGLRLRLVNAATATEPLDAIVCLPSTVPPDHRAALAAAHLDVLLAGNDLVSIGGLWMGDAPSPTQRMLDTALWPLQRWLRVDWLLRHGHFAVSADVFGLVDDSASDPLSVPAALASGEVPLPLRDALKGCRWVPNPAAVARCPTTERPANRRAARHGPTELAELLGILSDLGTGPDAYHVDLSAVADSRTPLWMLAAAPHRVLDVTFDWTGRYTRTEASR